MTPRLCIELHDVAAPTWAACERLLDLIDGFGRAAVSLLVVPDYHGRGRLAVSAEIVRALHARVHDGAEIVLHGYFHRDDAPPPRAPGAWLRRQVLTAGEGEFAALAQIEAAHRLRRGYDEIRASGWTVHGFVAPAWLYGDGAWSALRQSPLCYAATRDALILLDGMHARRAPAITVSARSAWRRRASRAWLHLLQRSTARSPLLRVALHPCDAAHAGVCEDWRRLIGTLLERRKAVTLAQAAGVV